MPKTSWKLVVFAVTLACAACTSLGLNDGGCDKDCRGHAKVVHHPTVMSLARDLDHLENHIERHGSVVIQRPSIWGQARLMKYRQEFEEEMVKDLTGFHETLQGRIQRDDQAFFSQAMALGIAASGKGAVTTYPTGVQTPTGGQQATNVTLTPPIDQAYLVGVGKLNKSGAVEGADLSTKNAFVDPRTNTAQQFVTSQGAGAGTALKISLEPTILLEQKARYINYLNQIRRTNEGDDTADSPGYALHLMRIPVSVLPGKCTRKGHGAEVTLSIEPILGDELLPTTFRNLIINDLVDQIGFPLTRLLNDEEARDHFLTQHMEHSLHKNYLNEPMLPVTLVGRQKTPKQTTEQLKEKWDGIRNKMVSPKLKLRQESSAEIGSFIRGTLVANVSHSRMRNARLPFPPSQIFEVYGVDFPFHIGYEAKQSFRKKLDNEGIVHLHEAQDYLNEQLGAAYKFLTNQRNADLWTHCSLELTLAVQARDWRRLNQLRTNFRKHLRQKLGEKFKYDTQEEIGESREHSTTAALAWAILVEAALLNDQLVQDMKETASARQTALNTDWLDYYSPTPSPQAREAFKQYVRVRWPIHVFALDPQTQDQNIADSFTRRREMQLAMSLAFVGGKMSARSMTRYARRLDSEYDTIALNRTAIGFSHGEDTFGWRFYPRFQTPDVESNLTVLFRDQLIGGPNKDQELAQRQIEPGMRECVAIVIMPAFVPYVQIHTTSNWFHLTNPKHKVMDNTEAMRLSRSVRTIQNGAGNVADADCYRDGDFTRLLKKADQLAVRLPMQTAQALVPFENTLGGFQMFSTGVTDLTPELIGWYGAPGIDRDRPTTLFLVGDHYNVKQTRVIAGGLEVGNVELLSRQVMKVTIPGKAAVTDGKVNVRVATPYGVTNVLEVPVSDPPLDKNEFTWVPPPTAKATMKVKDGAATEFTFDAAPKVGVVDNVGHAKTFALDKAKLRMDVTLFARSGAALAVAALPTVDVQFKNGRAEVDFAKLEAAFKAMLQAATAGKDAVHAPSISRLEVASFIGTPDVGAGITLPVNPAFTITIAINQTAPGTTKE